MEIHWSAAEILLEFLPGMALDPEPLECGSGSRPKSVPRCDKDRIFCPNLL
jgi:hypothetical protein